MPTSRQWNILEPDLDSIVRQHPQPLEELAAGETAAIVLRQALPPSTCRSLIERLIDEELLYDPRQPIPEKFQQQAIPRLRISFYWLVALPSRKSE